MRGPGPRLLGLAAAAATAWACSGAKSDHAALEAELARARARAPAGVAVEDPDQVRATGTRRIETILPGSPLRGAGGLACVGDRIAVTEPIVDRLSSVRADGTVSRIGTPHGFTRPVDLVVDAAGVTFVATAEAGGVWRRERGGAWRQMPADLSELGGIALLSGGDLAVSECAQGGRVLRLHPDDGRVLETLATGLGCPGRLSLGADGRLLVPLREDGQVIALEPTTRSVQTLATDVDIPSAVGSAPDGTLVVLEEGTGRIRLVSATGEGVGRTVVSLPPGIADFEVCGETAIVSNAATGSLRAFKPWPGGERVLVPSGLVVPSAIVFSGADLLVTDRTSIKRVRDGGIELLVLARFDGMPPPVGLTGGPSGLVWVTAPERGELHQVDIGRGESTRIASGLDWPTSVLRTLTGDLVIAETGAGRVVKLGVGAVPFTIASGLMSPVPLATRGERILTAEPSGGRVLRLRADEAPTVLASGLVGPAGLATARSQPLYIAEEGKGTVVMRSRDGTVRRVIEGLALGMPRSERPLPIPIAVGPDGSVVVASPDNGSITRLWPY